MPNSGIVRVVLDTNILISACWKASGLEAQTVSLGLKGAFTICLTPAILAEYQDVLSRKKFESIHEKAVQILAAVEQAAMAVDNAHFPLGVAGDETDNRFLECAVEAQAEYIVTGNLRHFPAECQGTRVVNARQFLEECDLLIPALVHPR